MRTKAPPSHAAHHSPGNSHIHIFNSHLQFFLCIFRKIEECKKPIRTYCSSQASTSGAVWSLLLLAQYLYYRDHLGGHSEAEIHNS